jgi:uncharacterized protein YjbJ (UPF0337 family)
MANLDEAKGKAKQAVGDVTGNDDMRREGKVDEKAGQAKDKLGDVKDKAENAIDAVKDKITGN